MGSWIPTRFEALQELGRLWLLYCRHSNNLGRHVEKRRILTTATPSPTQLRAEGIMHFEKREWLKAVACFSKAINLAPQDGTLYSDRAAALCEVHKYSKALQDADICISAMPSWVVGHARRGQALLGLGRDAEAASAFQAAERCGLVASSGKNPNKEFLPCTNTSIIQSMIHRIGRS